MKKVVLLLLISLFSSGCVSQYVKQKSWEDGVIYGARVIYDGEIDVEILLSDARRMRYEDERYQKEFEEWLYGIKVN